MPAIEVSGLRKAYGNLEAVRGVDFTIEAGEVFGLLGPNGAGKTTTVEILEGYRKRDGGEVRVLGHDPERPGADFRERIGVVLQQSELWPNLTVRETHAAFAGYYTHPRDVDEVIALVGLAEKADARVKTLSGGQKRRLDLGVALVGDPVPLGRRGRRRPHVGADARAQRTDARGARTWRRARVPRGAPPDARAGLSRPRRRGTARVRIFLHQLRTEQLVFWRGREAAFFIFLFPLLLFVLVGSLYSGRLQGLPLRWWVLAGLTAYGCANTTFGGLGIQ